ncbi:hypothetical protein HDU96_002806 [Phlyctochytrium bullatum]|nr:hypothetical protein HDU96_002806 [Phlyctochytrium bullatum]
MSSGTPHNVYIKREPIESMDNGGYYMGGMGSQAPPAAHASADPTATIANALAAALGPHLQGLMQNVAPALAAALAANGLGPGGNPGMQAPEQPLANGNEPPFDAFKNVARLPEGARRAIELIWEGRFHPRHIVFFQQLSPETSEMTGGFPTASDAADALRNYVQAALAMLRDRRYKLREPPSGTPAVDRNALANIIATYAEATARTIADFASEPGTTATAAATATTALIKLMTRAWADPHHAIEYVFNPDDALSAVNENPPRAAEIAPPPPLPPPLPPSPTLPPSPNPNDDTLKRKASEEDHPAQPAPSQPAPSTSTSDLRDEICRKYNRGYCQATCPFRRMHICMRCKGAHGEIDCNVQRKQNRRRRQRRNAHTAYPIAYDPTPDMQDDYSESNSEYSDYY